MSIHHSRTAASGSGSAQPRSHPFSSVSFSPGDGGADAYAVASGKNLLHIFRLEHGKGIGGSRLEEIRSIRISQHFQSPVQTTNSVSRGQNPQYPHLRDALRLPGAAPTVAPLPSPSTGGGGGININVTDVAWSLPQTYLVDDEVLPLANAGNTWPKRGDGIAVSGYEELVSPPDVHYTDPLPGSANEQNYHYPPFIQRHVIRDATTQLYDDSSVITAAGSNGVIVAWNANTLLSSSALTSSSSGVGSARGRSQQTSSITPLEQPEAAFLAHSRAVNRLAWHPTGRRPYLMLSASSDGTMKLWDRRATCSSSLHHGATGGAEYTATQNKLNQTTKSWFGFGNSLTVHSAHQLPTSAMLSTATWHCISTYQPKCEAVRDIRWNPVIDDLFAMVAGEWLLVYDIRIHKPMVKESTHAGDATSVDWHPSRRYVLATGGGRDRSVKVWDFESGLNLNKQDDVSMNYIKTNSCSFKSENSELSSASHTSSSSEIGGRSTQNAVHSASSGSVSPVKRSSSSFGFSSRHHKKKLPIYALNIAAPVTRVRWRPSNNESEFMAVATSSIYGANAGGHGNVGLWSVHRPFMPISVCEGHTEGAVTDFAWAPMMRGNETFLDSSDHSTEVGNGSSRQQILSVGRDGQCLLQDFTKGERPILHVPRACFALANLSPFQPGFGSLQIMAVHQRVDALDVNKRVVPDHSKSRLVFSISDQGDAEDLSKASSPGIVEVASELTHFSRLSELYVTKPGGNCCTKADICRHNSSVAKGLNRKAITQMWKTLATILDGSGLDGLPANQSDSHSNPMAYLLTPTLRNLLLQRADAGDVQTCVVLCEVMDVIAPPIAAGGAAKSNIPNLSITAIREWYLTYIDLLQQMCLFTQAASLIRYCSDPVVGALNQQSTTIHEACPRCGKPLLGNTTAVHDGTPQLSAQRFCRSCRGRIGLCFLCHQPVKGIFIWCPGCGHGGHLDHALEWFGTNEVCPTGCGHKCNLIKTHPPN